MQNPYPTVPPAQLLTTHDVATMDGVTSGKMHNRSLRGRRCHHHTATSWIVRRGR